MSVSVADGVVAVAPKQSIAGPSVIILTAGLLTGIATVGATINWKEVV